MGKKTKPGKRSPREALAAMPASLKLIAHMLDRADALKLTAVQRKRLAVAQRSGSLDTALLVRKQVLERVDVKPRKTEIDVAGQGENLIQALAYVELGLSEEQRARLNEAARMYDAEPAMALGLAQSVRDELAAQLDETLTLEEARGGKVSRETGGRTRCHDRDGLAALYDAGALARGFSADDSKAVSGARLAAGLSYRQLHEQRASDLRAQTLDAASGGAGDAHGFRFHRALDGVVIKEIEGRVAVGVGARGLHALRAVAGEGRLISTISDGGKQQRLALAALVRALDVAARYLRVSGHALLTAVHELA